MKCFCVFALLGFLISRSSAQYCRTPTGVRSQCISLFKCPQLSSVFNRKPLPEELVNFLRESQCGFDSSTPIVCCGPVPAYLLNQKTDQYSQQPQQHYQQQQQQQQYYQQQQQQQQRPTESNNVRIDPVSSEDSYLSSRGECGIDKNGDRIVGGSVTDLDEFPWMALLVYRTPNGKNRPECGGALVNHRYVLTAAHCLVGAIEVQVGKLITVRLGEYNTQTDVDCIKDDCADPPQEIPVQATYPHRGYSDSRPNKADDIGLVRLAQRARYTYFVQPICLVSRNSPKVNVGNNLVVAGWGKTEYGHKSPVKLKIEVPVYNKNNCVNKYRSVQVNLENTQICAGGLKDEDSCRGDSGGPLMRMLSDGSWESIGLVSFGNGCGKKDWPGVYTSVAGYLDWIENTISSSNH